MSGSETGNDVSPPHDHDHGDHHEHSHKYVARTRDVYLLGLAMVLCGTCVNWNLGMRYGLSVYYMAWLFSAALYFLLVLCLAELTSIVAFAGGSYGYVRCGLSPFWGFLVGVSEWLQNNTHMIGTVIVIGRSLNAGLEMPKQHWRALWYFLSYVVAIVFVSHGGKVFWYSMMTCACLTVIIIILFIFGAIFGDKDFENFANERMDSYEAGFMDNENMILRVVNYSGWMFMGCEAVTVSIAKTANAKDIIPRSMLAVYGTTLVLSMAVILLSFFERSNNFKAYYMNRFPFEYVFHEYYGLSSNSSAFLVLVPCFSSALGFLFASMYQTHALAMSGLLPTWLRKTEGTQRVPVRALLVCAVIQYIVCFISWRVRYDRTSRVFFTLSMTGASFAYVGIFATYIAFKRRFANLERGFVSPLGEIGAMIGIIFASINFICGVGFQEFSVLASAYAFIILVAIVWYKYVAEKTQFFSPEEQQKFLRAYVVKLNNAKQTQQQQQAHKRRVSMMVQADKLRKKNSSVSSAADIITDAQSPNINNETITSTKIESTNSRKDSDSTPITAEEPTYNNKNAVHHPHHNHMPETTYRLMADLEHVTMVLLGVRPFHFRGSFSARSTGTSTTHSAPSSARVRAYYAPNDDDEAAINEGYILPNIHVHQNDNINDNRSSSLSYNKELCQDTDTALNRDVSDHICDAIITSMHALTEEDAAIVHLENDLQILCKREQETKRHPHRPHSVEPIGEFHRFSNHDDNEKIGEAKSSSSSHHLTKSTYNYYNNDDLLNQDVEMASKVKSVRSKLLSEPTLMSSLLPTHLMDSMPSLQTLHATATSAAITAASVVLKSNSVSPQGCGETSVTSPKYPCRTPK